jgi:hypothetical protein
VLQGSAEMLLLLQMRLLLLLVLRVDLELLQLLRSQKRLYMAALETLWIATE